MNKKFVSVVNIAIVLVLSLVALVPVGEAESSWAKLTILHTNDEHSAVIPFNPAIDYTPAVGDDPTVGGFARLATEIYRIKVAKALRREPVLTLGAGDFLMGTMFSWLGGVGLTPELTLMQLMGYDAVTLGNHEYDWTAAYLASYLSAAGYPRAARRTPIVASNVIIPQGHPLEAVGVQPYIVKKLPRGLKVGIFGIIGYGAISDCILAEIPFADPLETAAEMVDVLTALKVDLIICLSHSGVVEDMGMAAAVSGIDIIVGGHSHDALFEPITVGETIIVQAGAETRYLGKLELLVHDGRAFIRNSELIPIDDSVPAFPLTKAVIDYLYVPALNQMVSTITGGMFDEILDVLAESEFDICASPSLTGETSLGDLVTDSMRAMTAADFAIEADGMMSVKDVLRGCMPGKEGLISVYDLTAPVSVWIGPDMMPSNTVVSFYLNATEIKRLCEMQVLMSLVLGGDYFLQVSGLRFAYKPDQIIDPATGYPTFDAVTLIEQEIIGGYTLIYNETGWWVPLDTLYEVAGDFLEISFIPMIVEMFPPLTIVMKDEYGFPILDPTEAIVYISPGVQLKVSQALLFYVISFPDIDSDGIPNVPDVYAAPMGRIIIN